MNMLIFLYFAINQKITAKKKETCRKSTQPMPSLIAHISVHFSRCTYVPISPTRYRMYVSSTKPLVVPSTPDKH